MALFGSSRDVSMFRYVNRELLWDIVTQQVAYYKYNLNQTRVNMYGENVEGKYYIGPVLLNCLIDRNDQAFPTSDLGVDLSWSIKVAFLIDDLKLASVYPEVGDVIMYQEGYFEVDNVISNQQFVGKDPDYPYEINPLNPGLENFGYNVSIICDCHYVPQDKVNLVKARM
jgi:hypothetical protein